LTWTSSFFLSLASLLLSLTEFWDYAALWILFALQKLRLDVIRSRSAHQNLHQLVASSGLLDGFSFLFRDIRARLIWPVQHLDGWVFEVSLDFRAGLIASLDAA